MTCPVLIHGQTYPSQTAAAIALGLSSKTIWNALERGSLDTVGTGKRKGIICFWMGECYPSLRAASRTTGVAVDTIRRRLGKITATSRPR